MLSFITGPSGSRRFEKIIEQAKSILTSSEKRFMIVVPEQVSFQTERKCFERLGAQLSRRVDVLSFTRLCHLIFKTYGGGAGNYANHIAKHMIMELALEEIKDGLELYKNSVGKEGFSSLTLQTIEELKYSGIAPGDFACNQFYGKLKKKSNDIMRLYSVYQGMLEKIYRDPSDDLTRATKIVERKNFFEQYTVYFHEFIQFSRQQRDMISAMMSQTDVRFSLCYEKNDKELFHASAHTIGKLKQIAALHQVKIQVPLELEQKIENNELSWLERNILRSKSQKYPSVSHGIHVICCANEYNESEEMLSKIWEIVKQGYRFRDIAIVSGDLNGYRNVLENALDKYQIPYFMDEKASAEDYALMRCAANLLEAAAGYELPLDVLKSGVTEYDVTEVSAFENYIYVWGIKPSQLKKPFTQNPRGFITLDRVTEQDKEALELVEGIRRRLVNAVETVKAAQNTARAFGQAIIEAFEILNIPRTFEEQVLELERQNELVKAHEHGRVWDVFIEILEAIDYTAAEYPMVVNLYSRLFQTAISEYDMGSIPQSVDCVTVGDYSRVILDEPKVVFVFGANDGVFPKQPSESGIFTDLDREQLQEFGLELRRSVTDRVLESRLKAYQILTAPSDLLYISARHAGVSGDSKQSSEIIEQLTKIFGKEIMTESSTDGVLHLCQTKAAAFLQLALNYRENNEEIASIKQYFADDSFYGPQIEKLENAVKPADLKINIPENAELLFGKNIVISPSQAENYYKCPFSFFCQSGMKAYPRKKADLDPLSIGTVVHHVMEYLLKINGFAQMSEDEIDTATGEILESFLKEFMGGSSDKSAAFVTRYINLKKRLVTLAMHIQREFPVSEFRPVAFEMKVKDKGDIKPVVLPLSKNRSVKIVGEIDRVDTYERDGKTYLKVVDYKSGKGKQFNISDLYHGLSMQMLIYLFSLWENGKDIYSEPVPAGVLYMPAGGADSFKLSNRGDGAAQLEKELDKSFAMNGLLLNDMDIVQAMERISLGQKGRYVPVSLEKEQSEFTRASLEFLLTEEEMRRVKKFTMREITKMCESLLDGEVNANPLKGYGGGYRACDYCNYVTVCGHEPSHGFVEVESFDKTEFMRRIQEENND